MMVERQATEDGPDEEVEMMTQTPSPARPRKPRGEYAKTSAKRTAILDAALEVFAESGYRSGSLRDVAVKVGMSEAGLLHHFPSKSALLAAVLERRDQHSRERVPFGAENGEAALRGLIDLAAYNASIPGVVELYCVLSAEATAPDHPAHEYFTGRYELTRASLRESFEGLEREGRLLPGVTPQQAAVATLAMMDGLQVQWLLNRRVVDMSQALEAFFRGFVAGFAMMARDDADSSPRDDAEKAVATAVG